MKKRLGFVISLIALAVTGGPYFVTASDGASPVPPIDAGLNYIIHNSERFYGKWSKLPDGHVFDYTALGLSTYKGRITVRHAKEDGAFVSFISFGNPYKGTYADISAKHAASWRKYYSASEVNVPDAEIMQMRRMAEYQLKCCTTKWSIPPGIPPSHWSAGIFAFDEMYAVRV